MLELFMKLNPLAMGLIAFIGIILISTIILMFVLRKKYNGFLTDLNNKENRKNGVFMTPAFNGMVDDYRFAVENNVEAINTPAIIDKRMAQAVGGWQSAERFNSRAISLMVILGLLGTFYGLTLAVGEIVVLLASTKGSIVTDMTPVIDGLSESLTGMSVAFLTSLCGILGSVIVTVFNVIVNTKDIKEAIAVSAEEYLDHHIGRKRGAGGGEMAVQANFDVFGERLESNLKELTSALNYRLGTLAGELATTTESLGTSIDKFDNSLNTFADNTRDFAEFNHHLRSNIQRMSLSFDDMAQRVESSVKHIPSTQMEEIHEDAR